MNDDTMALAALRAGVVFDWCEERDKWGAWTLAGDVAWLDKYLCGTLRDYADAARALGLVPDVVVIPKEVAKRMVATNRMADAIGGEYHMIGADDVDALASALKED